MWASDFGWFAFSVELDHEMGQMYFVRIGVASPNGGLDQGDILLLQGGVTGLTAVTAIGQQGVHIGTLDQVGQGLCQKLAVVHVVGCQLYLGDQLQLVFRVAGFGDVGNIALVMGIGFGAVGSFQVIHRLQATRCDLTRSLRADTVLDQVEVFGKQPFQHLAGHFASIGRFEFLQEGMEGLSDLLQVFLHCFLAFDPVGVMSGAVMGVGHKDFYQAGFVRFAQDTLDPLQSFHQQLQTAGRNNVAGDSVESILCMLVRTFRLVETEHL